MMIHETIPDYIFQKCIDNGLVTFGENDKPTLTEAGRKFVVQQLNNEIATGELALDILSETFTPEEIKEYSS